MVSWSNHLDPWDVDGMTGGADDSNAPDPYTWDFQCVRCHGPIEPARAALGATTCAEHPNH